jgi:MTH538 TIR-like domain (DUF1863)
MMKRVFLSFKAEDRKKVDGVRLLAWSNNHELEFYDESVRVEIKSKDEAYISRVIREKIERASITICFLSEDTHTSEWVNWEISISRKLNRRVILMGLPNGPDRLVLPEAAKGLDWYSWDMDQLARLIDG